MDLRKDDAVGNWFCPDDPGETCYKTKAPRRSVTGKEAEVLAGAARNRLVLEIGTGIGISTRAMAKTARYMMTLDIDPWVADNVWPALQSDFPSLVCANTIINDKSIFDMAFVDGDHSHDAVVRDLNVCRRALKPFAPVFMHDYLGQARVAAAKSGFVLVHNWGGPTCLAVGILFPEVP